MSLLQGYIFRQTFWPLALALGALTALALLTQSLSTLELIVQNRQSASKFFWITILALPQLMSIILPMAVLLSALYALNRLNTDSEIVVARSTGVGPWQIADPILRLTVAAAIIHLLINLFLQPAAFREMRQNLLEVRMDLASRLVLPGQFTTPTDELTIYGQAIDANGRIDNVLIYDERDPEEPTTYVAEEGRLIRSDIDARLTLYRGSIQTRVETGELDFIEFESHQIDLSDVVAEDTVLRLKTSDRYLHELVRPGWSDLQRATELRAEAHNRLATPLYSIALGLLAVVFMAVGKHRRLGYGRAIAVCAVLGFGLRLAGFSVAAAAEKTVALNPVQYALPLAVIAFCFIVLTRPRFLR